jgi:hypothetical protein
MSTMIVLGYGVCTEYSNNWIIGYRREFLKIVREDSLVDLDYLCKYIYLHKHPQSPRRKARAGPVDYDQSRDE